MEVQKADRNLEVDGELVPTDRFLLLTGFRMFAVGVGNAVEDELREIASEPVAEHYFYTADFRTISNIGKKLQMKICVGESGGQGRFTHSICRTDECTLLCLFKKWSPEAKLQHFLTLRLQTVPPNFYFA